ncbi:MAG: TVP38/TMEM64 family protein [Gemmatimonadetes bacterium]|nr:TVP38/TMEM64 family protein [Gemmatimonadota bacterium]
MSSGSLPKGSAHQRLRILLVTTWAVTVAVALYLYFFQRDAIQNRLSGAFSTSLVIASAIYLAMGAARAFTLIPSTYLVLAGLPLFPPVLLFILTLVGIGVSSAIIYRFSESLHLHELFEQGKHKRHADRLRDVLQRHELPIIIGWSFFPLAPTDLICYVCGLLEVNFPKFLVGILVGEGTICAIYIFFGTSMLRFLGL